MKRTVNINFKLEFGISLVSIILQGLFSKCVVLCARLCVFEETISGRIHKPITKLLLDIGTVWLWSMGRRILTVHCV